MSSFIKQRTYLEKNRRFLMVQSYKIINFQTNNLAEKAKIQGNNSVLSRCKR